MVNECADAGGGPGAMVNIPAEWANPCSKIDPLKNTLPPLRSLTGTEGKSVAVLQQFVIPCLQ